MHKLKNGQKLFGKNDLFWWREATIIGIDTTKTMSDKDVVVFVVEESWFHHDSVYTCLKVEDVLFYLKSGEIRFSPFE